MRKGGVFSQRRKIRFGAMAGLGLFALSACAAYDESAPADEVIATDESSLMEAECIHDGGCVDWDATNGCTRLMCCTVCGGNWRCSESPTLGGETCVFYPSAQ